MSHRRNINEFIYLFKVFIIFVSEWFLTSVLSTIKLRDTKWNVIGILLTNTFSGKIRMMKLLGDFYSRNCLFYSNLTFCWQLFYYTEEWFLNHCVSTFYIFYSSIYSYCIANKLIRFHFFNWIGNLQMCQKSRYNMTTNS